MGLSPPLHRSVPLELRPPFLFTKYLPPPLISVTAHRGRAVRVCGGAGQGRNVCVCAPWYPPPVARAIGPPRNRDPPRRSRDGAGEGRQWCKAIVVCRVSEITSQVKSSSLISAPCPAPGYSLKLRPNRGAGISICPSQAAAWHGEGRYVQLYESPNIDRSLTPAIHSPTTRPLWAGSPAIPTGFSVLLQWSF